MSQTPDAACVHQLVDTYGRKAFRRKLAPAEIDRLATFTSAQIASHGLATGVRQFFLYLLGAPEFLYRTEMGAENATAPNGNIELTAYEKAQAISYFITDGPPDAMLAAAADAGGLANGTERETHARRLLATADGAPGILKLYREHFETGDVTAVQKDPIYTNWNATIAGELATEADQFVRQVLWKEDAKFSTLLTANFTMADGPVAAYYGVSGVAATDTTFHKVQLPPGQRSGLLTEAGQMTIRGIPNDTSPVRRALMVRENVLCQKVPDPPPTINAVPPQPDGMHNQRERFAVHSADPTCAACHALMDSVGLSFEDYDGIGRYRTMDVGKPIDTAGTITNLATEFSFTSAIDLMQKLTTTPEATSCFARSTFEYASGRTADASGTDKCALDRLGKRFTTSGGDMLDLAAAIVADDSFIYRR
jgi:hypothetical protein